MTEVCLKYISQLSNYLKIPVTKLQINDASLPSCIINNSTVIGFSNIITGLLKHSKYNLLGETDLDEAEVRQWLEYSLVYAMNIDSTQTLHQLLRELNGVLSTKTYLVMHVFTIADVLLYYVLQKHMAKLTYLEKEKYMNVCRWFDNIQHMDSLTQTNDIVSFKTNYLVQLLPIKN